MASTISSSSQKAEPAQVAFLAIYNPSLGHTDETLDDQIAYYYSAATRKRYSRRRRHGKSPPDLSQDEKNERLRQIGLAQGMVEFGSSFSEGKSVDTVETEKSRIILHEMEQGWWLLASIELTRLPSRASSTSANNKAPEQLTFEYSSREVKPSALLLQDLLRAHSTFLLHHASSMSALFVRTRRPKFLTTLGRYWDAFLSTWNVMMHGNPIVNVYGGIKLAASGELGMGVGEEDRGSGEREVLEGFVGRVDGLVDLVVSKFGDTVKNDESVEVTMEPESQSGPKVDCPWLGTGAEPTADDGAIFLGVGALSRHSLRDITHWMEDLYSWGHSAYGVAENPTSTRKVRPKMKSATSSQDKEEQSLPMQMDPPSEVTIHSATRLMTASTPVENAETGSDVIPGPSTIDSTGDETSILRSPTSEGERRQTVHRGPSSVSSSHSSISKGVGVGARASKFTNYFKMGYGTHWTLSGSTNKSTNGSDKTEEQIDPPIRPLDGNGDMTPTFLRETGREDSLPQHPRNDSAGHFLIGLIGDIDSDEAAESDQGDTTADETTVASNSRTLLRTVTVELERERDARAEADISIDLSISDNKGHTSSMVGSEHTGASAAPTATSYESQDRNKTKKLRVVVYVSRPFIFTFLFELRTDALALKGLYRALHHQLSPLHRPLLLSTNQQLLRPDVTTTDAGEAKTPIYDIIWDPKSMTITSSIPNIPDPGQEQDSAVTVPPWSRIEALNTHLQLLNTFNCTRNDRSELERTSKTSRGWWVVWTRILDSDVGSEPSKTSTSSPIGSPRSTEIKTEEIRETSTSRRTKGTSKTASTIGHSTYSGPAHPFLETIPAQEAIRQDKEIFLIRRASDHVSKLPIRFGSGSLSTGEGGWGSGPAKLAQGIGVDTKRYIEGLLHMG